MKPRSWERRLARIAGDDDSSMCCDDAESQWRGVLQVLIYLFSDRFELRLVSLI